jgi:hypothetical protein
LRRSGSAIAAALAPFVEHAPGGLHGGDEDAGRAAGIGPRFGPRQPHDLELPTPAPAARQGGSYRRVANMAQGKNHVSLGEVFNLP